MTYVVVKNRKTVVSQPVSSYQAALKEARRMFGDDVIEWMQLNLRIEEARS